jgi:hypothetical protein
MVKFYGFCFLFVSSVFASDLENLSPKNLYSLMSSNNKEMIPSVDNIDYDSEEEIMYSPENQWKEQINKSEEALANDNPLFLHLRLIQANFDELDDRFLGQNRKEKKNPSKEDIADLISHVRDLKTFFDKNLRQSKYLPSSEIKMLNEEVEELSNLIKKGEELKTALEEKKFQMEVFQEIVETCVSRTSNLKNYLVKVIAKEKLQNCDLFSFIKKEFEGTSHKENGDFFDEKELLFLEAEDQINQLQDILDLLIEKTDTLMLDSQEDLLKLREDPNELFSKSIKKVIQKATIYPLKYSPLILKYYMTKQLNRFIDKTRKFDENPVSLVKWQKHKNRVCDLMEFFLNSCVITLTDEASYILQKITIKEIAQPKIDDFYKKGLAYLENYYKNNRGTTTKVFYQLNIFSSNTRKVVEEFSKKIQNNLFKTLCPSIPFETYKKDTLLAMDKIDNDFSEGIYSSVTSTYESVKNVGTSLWSYVPSFWGNDKKN